MIDLHQTTLCFIAKCFIEELLPNTYFERYLRCQQRTTMTQKSSGIWRIMSRKARETAMRCFRVKHRRTITLLPENFVISS